jgi:isoquinoline 1-oxidoreductase subunit alpha
MMVNVRVNGQDKEFDGDPSMPLMWYLRDELGLTGTKFACGVALCGACTVHLDGEAVRSCGVQMSDVAGKSVTTIEGLDPKGEHPVQVAWRNLSVPQCGYCQTGQIIQAPQGCPAGTDRSGTDCGRTHAGRPPRGGTMVNPPTLIQWIPHACGASPS